MIIQVQEWINLPSFFNMKTQTIKPAVTTSVFMVFFVLFGNIENTFVIKITTQIDVTQHGRKSP